MFIFYDIQKTCLYSIYLEASHSIDCLSLVPHNFLMKIAIQMISWGQLPSGKLTQTLKINEHLSFLVGTNLPTPTRVSVHLPEDTQFAGAIFFEIRVFSTSITTSYGSCLHSRSFVEKQQRLSRGHHIGFEFVYCGNSSKTNWSRFGHGFARCFWIVVYPLRISTHEDFRSKIRPEAV